jgi:hypothetical protein
MKKPTKSKKSFKMGTVAVFDPSGFNPDYWNNLSEKDRKKYYGPLGYGKKKTKFFIFICEILNAPGHCVLVDMDDGHVEYMRHTSDFREINEGEF